MPMAQCQTEGKNHTATGSFDLYTGLFATKLHTSNGVTDNLDRFQGGVKYNEVSSNYATGKVGNGSFVKEDSYNKVSPYVGSFTDDNFKIRSDSGKGNMGKADYGSDATTNLRSVSHHAPAGTDNFRGMSAVHNVAASFQKMGLTGNGPLDKSGYGYSRGFYSKDAAAAETALALWGRPEVEIPKDDSSCFVGGFSSSGDRSSHSSGELTSSDGHVGHGGKDLDLGSWSGRSSSGSVRLKPTGSPSADSPNVGSSSGGSTSGGSSIGGSPTVVRTSSSGNLFTNGTTSYVNGGSPGVVSARAVGSSRGSSTEGSPTSSRNNPGALPTSRSLNEIGTSGGGFAYLGRNGSDRTGERAFGSTTTPSRTSGDGSSPYLGSRDRGDDSPTLEISSGVSSSRTSSDDRGSQAPRKSTSDLPPPNIHSSRHVRQPSLGVGFYAAGTSTSKSSSGTSPSGSAFKGAVSPSNKGPNTHTSPAGIAATAPRSPSDSSSLSGSSGGVYPPSRSSSDPNPVRHSSDASLYGPRYPGVPAAASRTSSDVSSNGSTVSGGATSRSSPEVSSTGNIYSAGQPAQRVGKDVSSNGNVYQKGAAPARTGSDVSATGNIYPGKIPQSTSTGNIPAGGVPAPRHGSEGGANSNIQSATSVTKPVNGLSANGFCVGGNFCGVTKIPTGVIHNGVASGKNALNSGTLNGKSQNGRVLNAGIITGGNFGTNKRDGAQTTGVRSPTGPVMITKGLSMMDPEELKNLGNDLYKKGQFAEALSLYDKAIVLCPDRAPYRSNRAAALTGLGKLAEAERECKEALRLDPAFTRAHQRLGSIYLRLGRVEDSNKHFKCAVQHTERSDIQKIENIDKHLTKCLEAKRALDWSVVIKESDAAVAAGADSAPQILALKAEALLKLHRLDEADTALKDAQKMEALIGRTTYTPADTHILVVQAQIDMALGRFEDATKAAEGASHLDPYNLEILTLLKRARAVGSFRNTGNELFNAGRFAEAISAYGEGLQVDPANAVLLCNRAACRLKMGHWEKAVEDCNAALDAQPQYTKALLRRANCYAKLERWEDSRKDYELVRKRCPADVDVARQLFEVEVELKKSRGEDIYKMKFTGQIGGHVVEILSSEQLRDAIRCPGLAVVHFNKKENERCRQLSLTLEHLCRAYPAVNFVKVDVDENMSIAVSESINFIPTFKLYKNGLKVQEILAPSQHVVEQAVKSYCH